VSRNKERNNILGFLSVLSGLENLSGKSHILLLAYYLRQSGQTDFSATELKSLFAEALIPLPKPISTRLSQLTKGKTAPLLLTNSRRYSLTIYGLKEVEQYLKKKPDTYNAETYLGKLVGRIQHDTERKFLVEAMECFSIKARRATIIMTWLLVMSHLQEYILKHKVNDFNQAYLARKDNVKKLQVETRDDFLEMKEVNFIETCRAAKIISKDARKILDEKLGTRNTCAHPSDTIIHDTKVINVIEDLVDNVILKYPL